MIVTHYEPFEISPYTTEQELRPVDCDAVNIFILFFAAQICVTE